MVKIKKTNAIRLLDQKKVQYTLHEYDVSDGQLDGITVAHKVGFPIEMVYKTLVCRSQREYFVFIVPVAKQLNLKKAAKVAGVKKVEMLQLKELLPRTGYVHGGCSPVGMKRKYPTFIDESAVQREEVVFSAGAIGLQVKVKTGWLDSIEIQIGDLV